MYKMPYTFFILDLDHVKVRTYQISFDENITYLLINSFIFKKRIANTEKKYPNNVCLSLLLCLAALSVATSVQKYLACFCAQRRSLPHFSNSNTILEYRDSQNHNSNNKSNSTLQFTILIYVIAFSSCGNLLRHILFFLVCF